jgi:hypothetical protein
MILLGLMGRPWTTSDEDNLSGCGFAALTLQARAKDARGPQWHFMDKTANLQMVIRP